MLNLIRNKLKKFPIIYAINAAIKSRLISTQIKQLSSRYEEDADRRGLTYSASAAVEVVRIKVASRGIPCRSQLGRKPRVFWVGAHRAQDYSGFIQSLHKFAEVITYQNHEGGYGLAYPNPEDNRKQYSKIATANSCQLLAQVIALHKETPIDMLMGQMWADYLDSDVLSQIQGMGIITVNVSMDDKLPSLWKTIGDRRLGSVGLVRGLDLVLTTTPEACLWYLCEGCPALYWPLASSPDLFAPSLEKPYDVVFVGGRYGLRGKLVGKLVAAGIEVEAFGPGWPNGFIDTQKIVEVFGRAKIVLGSGYVGYSNKIMTLKLRDFDVPMSGALYVTNPNPDLLKLFCENREVVCYSSIEECIAKIRYYLDHPTEAQAIANAGRYRASTQHTWDIRITELLKAVGFPLNPTP